MDDIPSPRGPDSIRIARVSEHSFLAAPITTGSTIVDLGTNSGGFATKMISTFGCAVVGVEPVPELFQSIPATRGLTVQQLAVSADGQPVTLFLNASSLAATTDADLAEPNVPTIEVASATLEEVLDVHDITHTPLIKVEIEGAELGMLSSAAAVSGTRSAMACPRCEHAPVLSSSGR